MRIALVIAWVSLLALGGCAASDQNKAATAVTTPLSDLNLVNAPIPDTLAQAQKAPYQVPADLACPALAADIRALDAVLGADLDTPATDTNPSLVERGSNAVAGAAQKAVEGAIPFRGWVRKLSGAERYSKQVAAAINAGTVRRAFLKGMAKAGGC
jgi:hypothetical protein